MVIHLSSGLRRTNRLKTNHISISIGESSPTAIYLMKAGSTVRICDLTTHPPHSAAVHAFLNILLEYEPRQRAPPTRACRHPWLQGYEPTGGVKRKSAVDQVSGSLSSLSLNGEARRPTKRARGAETNTNSERGSTPVGRTYRSSYTVDEEEVPGLGQWRDV